ncbi:MAG: sugar ABC transporter permease, partial [Propionicimonas sp.]|nr:sugar ABC transporter permease [Propionicimonas sp.]
MARTASEVASGVGAPSARPAPRRRFTTRTGLTILGYLAPAFVFVVIFTYYPLFVGGRMAFQRWTLWDLTSTPWVGLGNFQKLVADPLFGKTMLNSAIWVVGSLLAQFVIGFLIALALRQTFRFRGVYQAVIFYPWAVSGFLIGILFRWMFNSEFGVINDLLQRTGITSVPIPWLANPNLALLAVIIANVWYGVTFFAI